MAHSPPIPTILSLLATAYPQYETALIHENRFQLLVSVVLSAQTTDRQVNRVTPTLFGLYPDAIALAGARQKDVEDLIRSTGYFRQKSVAIRGLARRLVSDFGGEVPRRMEDLILLPGVGRKTANVVLGEEGIVSGVVVDTHIGRVSRRLLLSQSKNPIIVEKDLMALLPKDAWIPYGGRAIQLGRGPCDAKKPDCGSCPLSTLCPSQGKAKGIK